MNLIETNSWNFALVTLQMSLSKNIIFTFVKLHSDSSCRARVLESYDGTTSSTREKKVERVGERPFGIKKATEIGRGD